MRRVAVGLALLAACGQTSLQTPDPTSSSSSSTSSSAPPTSTSVVVPATTTSTTSRPAPPPTRKRASRSRPGGGRVVVSTAYCLTGRMANGQRVYEGAVAANAWPLGTRLRITELGRVFTVADHYGHGTQLDIAMPGRCAAARHWGRRVVHVEVVS